MRTVRPGFVVAALLSVLFAGLVLGGCDDGDAEPRPPEAGVTTPDEHPSRAAVDAVADRVAAAVVVVDPVDSGSTTRECTSDLGDFGSGEFATLREFEATSGATADLLDAVIEAVLDADTSPGDGTGDDARIVSDRPKRDPVSGETIGRSVDLALDRDGVAISVTAVVDDGRFFAAVESTCA